MVSGGRCDMSTMGWDGLAACVIKHDYCCGCGVCAGVCPAGALEMRFNANGEYRPCLSGGCAGCGLCAKVCPFAEGNPNEDALAKDLFAAVPHIKHAVETGYYLDMFVGHAADPAVREGGASGGMATWFLEKLLSEKAVDYVMCVGAHDVSGQLFHYTVCRSAAEIRSCSRSCYYPVTAQEMVSFAANNEGRCAIVGLPCVCKAIRLAQQRSNRLRERIKYVVGLVCGQTKSKFFAEYICAMGGGDPSKLMKVKFRVKDARRPATDFGLAFSCVTDNGALREGTVFWTEGMGRAWGGRHFTPKACDFCDDIYAECADIVFMDAWLPGYGEDWRGHSIALCRKPGMETFLRGGELEEIPVEMVIESQKGVVKSKRRHLAYRLFAAVAEGCTVPTKRVSPSNSSLSFIDRQRLDCLSATARRSPGNWLASGKDHVKYDRLMERQVRKGKLVLSMCKLLVAPYVFLKRIGQHAMKRGIRR